MNKFNEPKELTLNINSPSPTKKNKKYRLDIFRCSMGGDGSTDINLERRIEVDKHGNPKEGAEYEFWADNVEVTVTHPRTGRELPLRVPVFRVPGRGHPPTPGG